MRDMRILLTLLMSLLAAVAVAEPRARDLGVPFDGKTGPLNAITDVAGVTVGHVTLIEDLANGRKVRTGVTAILPRGRGSLKTPVFAGGFVLNGAGEMTGTSWIEESGTLDGPVMLTNTHSVGTVHEATIAWRVRQGQADAAGYFWSTPVVAETWDGHLNDVNGFHVKAAHVNAALDSAKAGPVAEGNVGGGTGMTCHEFKCGIGTASRRVDVDGHARIVGVLVQANYGTRDSLRIAGVPVGQHLQQDRPKEHAARRGRQRLDHHRRRDRRAAPAAPAEAHRAPGEPRARTPRFLRRQRLGRHLRRVLDGERGGARAASRSRRRSSWTTAAWTACSRRPCRRRKRRSSMR